MSGVSARVAAEVCKSLRLVPGGFSTASVCGCGVSMGRPILWFPACVLAWEDFGSIGVEGINLH